MNEIKQKQNRSSAVDALLMVALVFSLFTFLCLVTRSTLLGEFGTVYSDFVLGTIGFVSYGTMPLIACYCIFQLFTKKNVNALVVLSSIALYVIGITMIFHILTSSSELVFSGSMEYYEYVNESFFLEAEGVHGATAGGAFISAILFYIIQNVGIVGANIVCMLIIALATFGVWLVIRKMLPHKAKAPKIKKAKKQKIQNVSSEAEYPDVEYNPEEHEFYEEEQTPKKRYNLLGMEVINPVEDTVYAPSPKQTQASRFEPEQKTSKLHVINIEEPQGTAKRKKKTTAQDILFNGEESEDKTIASHNRVRHLGGMQIAEEEKFESTIPLSTNSQMMDIFSSYKPTKSNLGTSVSQTPINDYQIKSTSEFGIMGESSEPQPKADILSQVNMDAEKTKAMYDKQMPKVMPKILTMADLEQDKPKVEEVETAEEIIESPALSPEEALAQEQRMQRERMDQLKADIMAPTDETDMQKLQQIYPSAGKEAFKQVTNPRIITSISQLESQDVKEEPVQPPRYSDLNRDDFVYDVNTDEFIDKETQRQLEKIRQEEINRSNMPKSSFGVISDMANPDEEDYLPSRREEVIIDSFEEVKEEHLGEIVSENNSSEEIKEDYQMPIGFSKTEFTKPETDEVFNRQYISNPKIIVNPDGVKGEQLPIYSEEKIQFARPYIYPPVDLLEEFEQKEEVDLVEIEENARMLEKVLENFNIPAKVMDTIIGPTVTKYELEMPQGIQVKRVEGYSRDISLWLKSPSEVIIEAPIPGKNRVGIEVPNKIKQVVSLKEVIQSSEFTLAKSKTVFALGKDVTGKNILCDIKDMPHLLIAGATGMGKSVCLNTLIMSLIYHSDPSDLRMLLIDPKKVEFISYKEIPHLLINEIISDNDKAILALGWAIDEMEKRYTMFESVKQKDMDSYNAYIMSVGGKKLPRIVIVVDEVADLMSINKKEIEGKIQRLTQKARAAGIHLVLATQRPSVDVITGVIKTNLPSRIAFKLSNGIDSKTVIDEGGAERLLGRGDMFYRPASFPAKVRVQGCFVSTPEVDRVIEFVVSHNTSEYDDICYNAIFNANKKSSDYQNGGGDDVEVDEYFKDAVRHAIQTNNITITAIQRRFGLGFPRAGKIFDAMVARGYVADSMTGKTREILLDPEGFEREFDEPF